MAIRHRLVAQPWSLSVLVSALILIATAGCPVAGELAGPLVYEEQDDAGIDDPGQPEPWSTSRPGADAGPDASEPAFEPDAGEPAPEPDAGEPAPEPDAGEPPPEPDAGEPPPEPDAGEPAPEPDAGLPPPPPPVSYSKDVQPILDVACLRCHTVGKAAGQYRVDDHAATIKAGVTGKAPVKVGNPGASLIWSIEKGATGSCPLCWHNYFTAKQLDTVADWITQGAKNN